MVLAQIIKSKPFRLPLLASMGQALPQRHSYPSAQQQGTKRAPYLYSTQEACEHGAQHPSSQKRTNHDPNNRCTHSTEHITRSMTGRNNQYSWLQQPYNKTAALRDLCSTMPVYMNCMRLTHDCYPHLGPHYAIIFLKLLIY